jgi:dipeptidyl aminopeptidase/acylaminoacyl peptidase
MRISTILLLAALAATQPATAASPTASVPLIERTKLFGNPVKTQAHISPDGKWLSWIAPTDGVLNVWVAPAADPAKARALTSERARPIRQHFWAPDSSQILFLNDQRGEENFLLYGVDPVSGQQRALTPFEKTRVSIIATSAQVKDHILIGLNNRDARWHDVYSLDLRSGKLTLVLKNDGYASFVADEQLKLRLASKARDDGGSDLYRVSGTAVQAKPTTTVGLDDSLTTQPLGFTSDGKTLYWIDSRGRNTAALVAQDFASGHTKVIGESPKADIGNLLTDPKTHKAQAYAVQYLRTEWIGLDPAIGAELGWLQKELKGDVTVSSRTDADDRWTVVVDPVSAPSATYLYERAPKRLTKLYTSRPDLEGAPLVPLHPLEIRSRDGLTLVSYLSLPVGSDPGATGTPAAPVPMVLFVHGGPWGRDQYGYMAFHQWLANRGYAVLSVNYRGSTGFGKAFVNAGNLKWGTQMQDDLLDAVDWAVKHGITTAQQVAIMGGSYGGYATLAGLAFTPTAFACGVDIVGPSNLQTLLKTIPPYWEAVKRQFYQRMGDPTTEAGRKLLEERSPLHRADAIVRPLLIGQGANDPRVNQAESDQIVGAMSAKNIPVTYVLFPDEGHGFARPVNSIAFNAVAESFLAKCLGGRAEPIGDSLKASSGRVLKGAEFVPGLGEALGLH